MSEVSAVLIRDQGEGGMSILETGTRFDRFLVAACFAAATMLAVQTARTKEVRAS